MTDTKFTFAELRALRESSERRDKVTATLAKAVEKLADEIAENGEAGDEVQIGGMSLSIHNLFVKGGSVQILTAVGPWYDEDDQLQQPVCLSAAGSYPNPFMFYYQDFQARVAVPNRSAILAFAKSAGEILSAFQKLQDKKTAAAEKAISAMPEQSQ